MKKNALSLSIATFILFGCTPDTNLTNTHKDSAPLAAVSEKPENTGIVLLKHNDILITKDDFNNLLKAQVPERDRQDFLADETKIRQLIGNLYIIRQLAKEARSEGLHNQLTWAIEYQTDRVLMNERIKRYVEGKAEPDFAALAEAEYKANPEKFQKPETVSVSHILVSTREKTDAEALKLAQELRVKALSGEKSFEELASEFSDDPSAKNNQGNIGTFGRGQMVKPFEDVAFSMQKEGDISEPVKTEFGYHIIKFHKRNDAEIIPFERVKNRLIEAERIKFRKNAHNELIERVKSLEGIEVNQDAVKALVVPKEGIPGSHGSTNDAPPTQRIVSK